MRRMFTAVLAASLTLAGLTQVGPVAAGDTDKLMVSDEFSRSVADGWGAPAVGGRWLHPTGRTGMRADSGAGLMEHWKRAVPRLALTDIGARDVTIALTFSLDRLPGSSGAKVMTVARKSSAGEYRAGVRIGANGGVWLSLAKARNGGEAKSLGTPVVVKGLRYRAGQQLRLKTQVVRRDPTQLRAKVWPAGTPEPAKWQFVRNDAQDVSAGGRAGVISFVTEGEPPARMAVHIDRISISRAQDATKVSTPKSDSTPAPKPAPKPTPTPKPTPANVVNVPGSIDSTGSTNVSAALQSVINNAPNGSTIVFKAGGTYRLDKVLRIGGRSGLTLDGNGATLKPAGSALIVERLSKNTTIRDFAIVGNHAAAGTKDALNERSHALHVYGSTNTLIEDVDIRRVAGDCLYISAHQGEIWADGVTFRDSSCRLNGRTGVVIIAASNVRVLRNTFDDIAYSVMGVEPNTGAEGARTIVMKDNTVGSYSLTNRYKGGLFYACNAPWASGATVKDVTVTGNTVAGNPAGYNGIMRGLHVTICDDVKPTNYTVTNNTAARATSGPVIKIRGANGVVVTGNKQPLSSGRLVSCSGCSKTNIR